MRVLWKQCLAEIEQQVPSENFKTWFLPTYPHSKDGNSLNIVVPDEFFKRYLTENYLSLIETSLESISNSSFRVNFLVDPKSKTIGGKEESHTSLAFKSKEKINQKSYQN